jgi:hypothetical protein
MGIAKNEGFRHFRPASKTDALESYALAVGPHEVARFNLTTNIRLQNRLLGAAWWRKPFDPAVCNGNANMHAAALHFLRADRVGHGAAL